MSDAAGMFPWAFTILNIVLFEASYKPYLIGIALGHIYIFVKDIVFVKYGRDYLPTPQFLTNWWRKRMGLQPARQNV